jgi:hypothetical protein
MFMVQEGSSKASSPLPPADSHHPSALWKGPAGYYSFSQPLFYSISVNSSEMQICCQALLRLILACFIWLNECFVVLL